MDHDPGCPLRRDKWPVALLWQGWRWLGRQRRLHRHQSDDRRIHHRLQQQHQQRLAARRGRRMGFCAQLVGELQSEIARTLGVSVMTLHRWRKAPPRPQFALVATVEGREPDRTRGADDRIAELQLENSRLRRLVTDLLLEKVKLEEAAQNQTSVA